ncbi:hypothetical protein [uncultured Microscilla sp.]|uniref:hypothetical protein n=1 Tax=uncultured Microscilla sp. TaxID=432653 RepID=UPI00261B0A12|nr:hypothetical protein [uncultured Microscilla sp.]
MPNPAVMGSPTSGPMLNGFPGAGVAISTNPTITFGGTPVCVLGDSTGPTGPLASPACSGKVMIKGAKPVICMGGTTGTGAAVTASAAVLVQVK